MPISAYKIQHIPNSSCKWILPSNFPNCDKAVRGIVGNNIEIANNRIETPTHCLITNSHLNKSLTTIILVRLQGAVIEAAQLLHAKLNKLENLIQPNIGGDPFGSCFISAPFRENAPTSLGITDLMIEEGKLRHGGIVCSNATSRAEKSNIPPGNRAIVFSINTISAGRGLAYEGKRSIEFDPRTGAPIITDTFINRGSNKLLAELYTNTWQPSLRGLTLRRLGAQTEYHMQITATGQHNQKEGRTISMPWIIPLAEVMDRKIILPGKKGFILDQALDDTTIRITTGISRIGEAGFLATNGERRICIAPFVRGTVSQNQYMQVRTKFAFIY